jgi:cytochrome c553
VDALTWFASSLFILSLLMILAYQNGKILALERRVAWLERITAPTPPKQGPYRSPPSECTGCPESSPAACQACHEEEEAYVRRGI